MKSKPKLDDFPLFEAVKSAHEDPRTGLPRLARMIREVSKQSRPDELHVLSDALVTIASKEGRWLRTAERVARQLVRQQPDRFHLKYLSQICFHLGKKSEAAALQLQAEQAKDEHMTPEIEDAIRQARIELGIDPPST